MEESKPSLRLILLSILRFIINYRDEKGHAPSQKEIAIHIGLEYHRDIIYYLDILRGLDYITWQPGKQRSIVVTDYGKKLLDGKLDFLCSNELSEPSKNPDGKKASKINRVGTLLVFSDVLQSQPMSVEYLSNNVLPLIKAIIDVQNIIDEIVYLKRFETRVYSISQNSPITVDLGGVAQAINLILELFVPWKQKHAKKMAELKEREATIRIEREKAELLKLNIQNKANHQKYEIGQAELEAINKDNQIRKLEQDKLLAEIELDRAAVKFFDDLHITLNEDQRLSYESDLVMALREIAVSRLEISIPQN